MSIRHGFVAFDTLPREGSGHMSISVLAQSKGVDASLTARAASPACRCAWPAERRRRYPGAGRQTLPSQVIGGA